MQNIVIVRRSSLVYLAGTRVETGPHTSLGARVSCLKEPPRASESPYPNGSVAGRFCKSKSLVPLLQSSESF